MEGTVSYQRDTVKINRPLKTGVDLGKTDSLRIDRNILQFDQHPLRDTVARTVTGEKPALPTHLQIRYWQWNREQKLLVGGERLMVPRTDVTLTSTVKTDDKGLALPYRPVANHNTDWLTILLLFALILFASVRNSYSKYLGHLFHSVINYSTGFRMFQEKNSSVLQGAFRLEIYFYLTASVFVFQVFHYFQFATSLPSLLLFAFCLGAVIAYFFIKKMLYMLFGMLVEGSNETSEILFNMDNFNRVTGLFLFPIITVVAFYPFENPDIPVFTGIFIVVVIYLMLLHRGSKILLKKQFSIFYLFLYLCTLEILPLLLIFKMIG
ncbi:MAG: DUF4271 domain-containing protein [Bacteroidia bacterium]|nr:DUF4271 domain-containing protein [Bacteroidia bacterium]